MRRDSCAEGRRAVESVVDCRSDLQPMPTSSPPHKNPASPSTPQPLNPKTEEGGEGPRGSRSALTLDLGFERKKDLRHAQQLSLTWSGRFGFAGRPSVMLRAKSRNAKQGDLDPGIQPPLLQVWNGASQRCKEQQKRKAELVWEKSDARETEGPLRFPVLLAPYSAPPFLHSDPQPTPHRSDTFSHKPLPAPCATPPTPRSMTES